MKDGDTAYGDRDITVTNIPKNLESAEFVKTACDSKLYENELGMFTAAEDITVYLAVDSRVNNSLDWLNKWTKTGSAITTSNDVTLELYKMSVKTGSLAPARRRLSPRTRTARHCV